jgi:hypothetical protein
MSEQPVWRAAIHLRRRYGRHASYRAVQRAHALHDVGKIDRCEIWVVIFWAIRRLERQEQRTTTTTIH